MKLALPSEDASRIAGLDSIESALRPAKSFSSALSVLRSWTHSVRTTVAQLGARPDSVRLFNAVQPLLSELLRSDSQFAVEHGQIIRDVRVRVACSPVTLLAYTAALEAELAQRSRKETRKHRVTGRSEQFSCVEASAYAVGTRRSRPMCPHFLTPDGCPSGGRPDKQQADKHEQSKGSGKKGGKQAGDKSGNVSG